MSTTCLDAALPARGEATRSARARLSDYDDVPAIRAAVGATIHDAEARPRVSFLAGWRVSF